MTPYDVTKPAPEWAVEKACKQMCYPVVDSYYKLPSIASKHLAWMIATYEQPPVDPVVAKARRIYCALYGISEDHISWTDDWSNNYRNKRVDKIVEIINEEG